MAEITCPKCHATFTISEEEYKSIRMQLRDQEFVTALHEREQAFERSKLDAVKIAEAAVTKELQQVISEKTAEISSLKAQLDTKTTENELAVKNAVADKEKQIAEMAAKIEAAVEAKSAAVNEVVAQKETEIAKLKAQIQANKTEQDLAVQKAVAEKADELNQKVLEIEQLKGQIDSKTKEAELAQNNLKASYEQQLKFKDEEIERYKDFKAKQATFEKDNKISESGSKGDFIFRETEEGVEFISIMFEMKNEMDTTATKHKNEDFFKELDKDRREKKCEYAVLVTLLEPENDLYNNGIVDVSYKYEKSSSPSSRCCGMQRGIR